MNKVAAPLAAVLLLAAAFGLAACGGDGAEPGASEEATLVLDFQPNAVHAGIYSALERGLYEDEGVELTVREPSASTDAPKLLESGRAQFAILDIHDLGLAREQGFDLVGVVPLVQRALGSVLAAPEIKRPRELEGKRVGVTGLPSDDAVVDSLVEADGGDPDLVDRTTIGFNSVSALAAGKVDAATGFWNAEGIALREQGVPFSEFRVDDYHAPPYPELVMTTTRKLLDSDPELVESIERPRSPATKQCSRTLTRGSMTCSSACPSSTATNRRPSSKQCSRRSRRRGGSIARSSTPGPAGTSSTGSSSASRTSPKLSRSDLAVGAQEE